MQTVKFDKEEIFRIAEFLSATDNSVDLSSEFFPTAKLIAAYPIESEKLAKEFSSKKYTVVAREKDEIYGLASMDNEGNIGLLYVRQDVDYKKTSFGLLRALERRAEKKEIGTLNALSTEKSYDVLSAFGFEPYDSQKNGESFMVKEIKVQSQKEFSTEKVKRYNLNPSKPIAVEGVIPWWPSLLFGISCFFLALVIGISIGNYLNPSGAFGNSNKMIILLIVGVLFVISFAIFIFFSIKKSKLKKEILSMQVTNAIIVSDVVSKQIYHKDKDSSQETKRFEECSFTYMYYDTDMKSHTGKFYHKYQNKAPYFYKGQELIVACAGDRSYILKKYSFLGGESLLDVPEYEEQVEELDTNVKTLSAKEVEKANLVPLESSPMYFLYPIAMLGILIIVTAIVLTFSIIIKSQTGKVSPLLWVFWAFSAAVFGGIGAYYLVYPLRALKKYKNIKKGNVRYVNGKLKCVEKTYSNKGKNNFYFVFKTVYGKEQRISIKSTYVAARLQAGEDDVTVAYDDSDAVALVPKESISQALKKGKARKY